MDSISIRDLQYLWETVFKKIVNSTDSSIKLDDIDMYWSVSGPESYDMSKDPILEVGSLRDDLKELKRLINKDKPATFVDIDRFAAVLNAISQKLNPI